jgi:hypothetical protein
MSKGTFKVDANPYSVSTQPRKMKDIGNARHYSQGLQSLDKEDF